MSDGIVNRGKFFDLLRFAAPISAQNTIGISLLIVDMAMISLLGSNAVATIGVIRSLFFCFQILADSICQYGGAAISQAIGARNRERVWLIATTVFVLNIALALPFSLASYFYPEAIVSVLVGSASEEIATTVESYLKITAPFFTMIAMVLALSALLRASGYPRFPLFAAVVALTANTLLNYILMFGKLGFPAYGIEGAAFATILSRLIELAILFALIYVYLSPKLSQLKINLRQIRNTLANSYPIAVKSLLWSVGALVYGLIFLRADPDAYPNYAVLLSLDSLLFAVIYGFVVTIKIFTGVKIGERNPVQAHDFAENYIKFTFMSVVTFSILLVLLAPFFAIIFSINGSQLNIFYAIYGSIVIRSIFRSINTSITDGVMRAGSDNLYAAYIEFVSGWLFNIPLLLLTAHFLTTNIIVLVLVSLSDEIIRLFLSVSRFRSKKWLVVTS